jgi:hypothetical protein
LSSLFRHAVGELEGPCNVEIVGRDEQARPPAPTRADGRVWAWSDSFTRLDAAPIGLIEGDEGLKHQIEEAGRQKSRSRSDRCAAACASPGPAQTNSLPSPTMIQDGSSSSPRCR